jgi:hypothetical protein
MSGNNENPKTKFGVSKIPYSTVPAPVIAEVAVAMHEGAKKYGRHNYRASDVPASVYYDAARRHLDDWWEGEDFDLESCEAVHHVAKAIASLVVLRDAMIQETLIDDRPPASPKGWMDALNEHVRALNRHFGEGEPPHTEVSKKRIA